MQKLILSLDTPKVQMILDALGYLPHNRVRALIDEIVEQANGQTQEKEKEDG